MYIYDFALKNVQMVTKLLIILCLTILSLLSLAIINHYINDLFVTKGEAAVAPQSTIEANFGIGNNFSMYENQNLDLTMKYPPSWTVEEDNNRVTFTAPADYFMNNSTDLSAALPYLEVVVYPSSSYYPVACDGNGCNLENFANQTFNSLRQSSNSDLKLIEDVPKVLAPKGTDVQDIAFTYTVGEHEYKTLQIYETKMGGPDRDVYVTTFNAPISEFDEKLDEVASALYEENSMHYKIYTPQVEKKSEVFSKGLDECDISGLEDDPSRDC